MRLLVLCVSMLATVNSEIFARVLFSRNFAYAKFCEKNGRTDEITLSFTDIGQSCLSRELSTSQICILTLLAEMKFSRKFPNLQYWNERILANLIFYVA